MQAVDKAVSTGMQLLVGHKADDSLWLNPECGAVMTCGKATPEQYT